MLTRHDRRPFDLGVDDVICICCVRNEILRLPHFLDYYRRLGVARFFIVDNGSEDGTLGLLLAEPDVTVYSTAESYAASGFGVRWYSEILASVGRGRWVLVVDADELFVFPRCERVSLAAFTAYLDRCGARAVNAVLLDMYSERPLSETGYEAGTPFLDVCGYFDAASYPVRDERGLPLFGGPRRRLFWRGAEAVEISPYLRKFPLIKWDAGVTFDSAAHALNKGAIAAASGALLHFKFFADFYGHARAEAGRAEHWNEAAEYKRYWNMLGGDPQLTACFGGSVAYRDSAQLVAMGLAIEPPGFLKSAAPAPDPEQAWSLRQLCRDCARGAAYVHAPGGDPESHWKPEAMAWRLAHDAPSGLTVLRLWGGPGDAPSAGWTGGYSIALPAALETAASGRKITVRAVARAAGAAPSRLAMAYSTCDVGNSGWHWFDLSPGWQVFAFDYDVPVMKDGNGDFLGLLAASPEEGAAEVCYLAVSVA